MARSRASFEALDAYVHDLEQAFDPGRLSSYYPPNGNKLTMVTNYFWNVALCKELYLSMGTVEVTMRNAIHDTLTAHFQTPAWYDHPDFIAIVQKRQRSALAQAKKDLRDAKKMIIPGRVIAAVTFGFWTGLLSTPYGPLLWNLNHVEPIRSAFPYLAAEHQNRSYVHRRFNAIRSLRNRIGHHEPIWRGVRMQSGVIVSLGSLYNDILDAIGWVSPSVRASIVAIDRFPAALHHGYPAIQADIKAYLEVE